MSASYGPIVPPVRVKRRAMRSGGCWKGKFQWFQLAEEAGDDTLAKGPSSGQTGNKWAGSGDASSCSGFGSHASDSALSNGYSNFSVGVCSCVCAVSYSFNKLNFLQKKWQKNTYSFQHSDALILASCSWSFPDFSSQQVGGQLLLKEWKSRKWTVI